MIELTAEDIKAITILHDFIDGTRHNDPFKNKLHELIDHYYKRYSNIKEAGFNMKKYRDYCQSRKRLIALYNKYSQFKDFKYLSANFEQDLHEIKLEYKFFFEKLIQEQGGRLIKNKTLHIRLCKIFFKKEGINRSWIEEEIISSNKNEDCVMINKDWFKQTDTSILTDALIAVANPNK